MNHYQTASPPSKVLLALAGIIATGLVVMFARELPALRRELRLMRM